MTKALIVGAGINGLCTAWALLRAGWQVQIVEDGPIPNPLSASWDYHRIIRPHYAAYPGYGARIGDAHIAWNTLFTDIGTAPYVECGALSVSHEKGDWADISAKSLAETGVAHEVLAPEDLEKRFPMIESSNVRFALLSSGGALLADQIITGLLRWLVARGAELVPQCRVLSVHTEQGAITTTLGDMQADQLIVAAGIGLPGLFADMVGFTPRRSLVVYADPPPQWQAAWAAGPCWAGIGGNDDCWGIPPIGDIPMKLGLGRLSQVADPHRDRPTSAADTAEILAGYVGRFKDAEAFRPRFTLANFYLMAPDERFLLQRRDATLVLTADSGHGFKFGALTGLDVVAALKGDEAASMQRVAGY
ncbi:MAG: FAD-dependent oxidoreductase [Paracoccaceae bacterium]